MGCRRSTEFSRDLRREYDPSAMAGNSGVYVLAVRRGSRDVAPADWQERVRNLTGVTAEPTDSSARMQVEVDAEALARIRCEFGSLLRIEPVALRKPSE